MGFRKDITVAAPQMLVFGVAVAMWGFLAMVGVFADGVWRVVGALVLALGLALVVLNLRRLRGR